MGAVGSSLFHGIEEQKKGFQFLSYGAGHLFLLDCIKRVSQRNSWHQLTSKPAAGSHMADFTLNAPNVTFLKLMINIGNYYSERQQVQMFA